MSTQKFTSSNQSPSPHILVMKSERKSISMVEPFLNTLLEFQSLEETRWFNILIAVTEAVNNAIIHGNQSNPAKQVTLSVAQDGNDIVISVQDEGLGFNPAAIRDPREPDNLLREGGRGVFLIQALAKSVEYPKTQIGSLVVMRF
ncbi:MAG: ATP-binding protein [Ignavibacteria bacterium]|nr:ATP-binding protein [Ignavibacteria bacterium]